jgi:hypothetical protein
MIAKKACGAEYTSRFSNDAECEAECSDLPGSTEESAEQQELEYSLATARKGGDQVPCRTLHALRVLDKGTPADMIAAAATECPVALGIQECLAEP